MKYLLIVAALAVALGLALFGCTEEPELLQAPSGPAPGILKSALDGTEELGDPVGITIAQGTGICASGDGMYPGENGTINVTVPPGATLQQAILYWEGQHVEARQPFGDGEIEVNGNPVTGARIGGPTLFYSNYSSTTYRADITSYVNTTGSTTLNITEMAFDDKNSGAGVLIIYDDGSGATAIPIKDGNDLAYHAFAPPLDATVPQTLKFEETKIAKKGTLAAFAGSIQARPTNFVVTWDGPSIAPVVVEYCDLLTMEESIEGPEWATVCFEVDVPAGADQVTLEAVSEQCGGISGDPASFAWVCAAMHVPPEAEIGDYVWLDGNCGQGDNCQGAGDIPQANVTVNLYKSSAPTTIFMTMQTSAGPTPPAGEYLFEGLEAGQYIVEFVLPAGYEFVTPNACGITVDSDADQTTGRTGIIDLDWGESDLTWDAGICSPTATLGDKVWCDEDCDGCQEGGEPGIAGVTVNLYQGCLSSTVYLTTTTNASGEYLFENIPAGQYVVEFTNLPAHYEFTTQNACALGDEADSDADPITGKTACITLNAGDDDRSWDAGLVPLTAVGDYVWLDENRDGCQDTEEDGIAGVTVYLYECGNPTPVDDTTTDSNGWYQFDDVSPCKEYRLQFVKPSPDLESSLKDACGDDEKDSDADPTSGFTDCFVPSADCEVYDVDGSWDAGFSEPPVGCRMTGGAENTSVNIALGGDPALDTYSGSGQAGAPTALPPQPWGEWTHTQKRGGSGAFTFHAGTASAPPGTEIDWIECTDPGWCRQARHAPAKQIDFAGVGTFKNMKPSVPASIADHVTVGESMHWFEVNIDDLGEPGKAGKIEPPADSCPELGFGRNGGAGTGVCDCPDFYRIKIYEGPDDSYPVMYEVYGYINNGNYQIHPLTGRDRRNIESGGGRGR